MREQKTTEIPLYYSDKVYTVAVDSIRYTTTLIINQLTIGYAHYWLVLQDGNWQVVGDMPLCPELKNLIAREISAWHNISLRNEFADSGEAALKTGLLLRTLRSVMAFDHQMS